MYRCDVRTGYKSYKRLITFSVVMDAPFDVGKLEAEVQKRLQADFPHHGMAVSIKPSVDRAANKLLIRFPDQTIEGKALNEDEILGVLAQIEREALDAMRQRDLLALLA